MPAPAPAPRPTSRKANSRAAPGLKLVVVPHRGTGPATQAVIGGDVQVTFVSMGPHIELVRKGVLRVLAAATPKRMPYVPDVPTFAEQGFPGFTAQTWFALFAPRRHAARRSSSSSTATPAACRTDPEISKRLAATFVDPLPLTQAEFAALVKADAVKWERIVRESGAKLD